MGHFARDFGFQIICIAKIHYKISHQPSVESKNKKIKFLIPIHTNISTNPFVNPIKICKK